MGQDPLVGLDSDSLDCFTICDSSDLQVAFWYHKEAHSGYLLAESSPDDAMQATVVWDHPDGSPAIAALRFAL